LNYKIVLLSRSFSGLEKVRKKCKNSEIHASFEIDLLDIDTKDSNFESV
jgi:hypothetical protein